MPLTIGTCRLCGEARPLLRKSHLVPSSLYRHMKPGSALFGLVTPSAGVSLKGQSLWGHTLLDTRTAAEPVGSDLLCTACDSHLLGALDFYGHHVLAERLSGARRDGDSLIVEPVHYGRLKLFLWSVFWRVTVSADERFTALAAFIPLEDLRQRMLSGDPGEPELYPVSVMLLDQAQLWCLAQKGHPTMDPVVPFNLTAQRESCSQPWYLAPKGHPSFWLVAGRYCFVWGRAPTLTRERLSISRLDNAS